MTIARSGGSITAMKRAIVLTTGVFDVLHPGHIMLFETIWDQILTKYTLKDTDYHWPQLVVGINGDRRAAELKDVVVFSAEERKVIVEGCAYVSEVVVFEEDTPEELIRRLDPVAFVKGGDYKKEDMPEASVCDELRVAIVILPTVVNKDGQKYSSTGFKESWRD